ncbi:class A beta-lactamase [Elizabethkingia sp. HX WHF]|uniref:class A beta-lactamase n=1 Tax=Elizabethkingia sp. HX WHF TaxID=3003190 RepID=UPI002A246C82|nr:class A beta-lactamase [Elizabethkingia sp. HX WHF]MDX8566329.1 class A beta-lactamase [Elizabethkingia sp. HX WHF]
MKKISQLIILLFAITIFGQIQKNELTTKIEKIVKDKNANIGVSIIETNNKKIVDINGNNLYSMLSTVKFPIALTVLKKVEEGKLQMEQKIFIKKDELLENTWSPYKEKFPEGNTYITLEEAMKWMISYSDNNLTDIILRLIGGPKEVEKYFPSKNLIVKNNEEEMHENWDAQFVNKISPNEATKLLQKFYKGKILNKTNTNWLYNAMVNNTTGGNRIKGKLPKDIKVAHRTGTSFTNDKGMTGAINDFGIIEIPNKKKIIICILINDTYENFKKSEEIIADIAKTTYEYYLRK